MLNCPDKPLLSVTRDDRTRDLDQTRLIPTARDTTRSHRQCQSQKSDHQLDLKVVFRPRRASILASIHTMNIPSLNLHRDQVLVAHLHSRVQSLYTANQRLSRVIASSPFPKILVPFEPSFGPPAESTPAVQTSLAILLMTLH